MKKFVLFFLIIFSNLVFSNNDLTNEAYQLAVVSAEPSTNIANAVNAITGDYFISETDLIIQGYEPITINPIYISKNARKDWSFLNHLTLEYVPDLFAVFITDPKGTILCYNTMHLTPPKKVKNTHSKNDDNRRQYNENTYENIPLTEHSFKAGLTNCSNSEISARLNVKNNRVLMNLNRKKIKIICSDGTIRFYEKFKTDSFAKMEQNGMKAESVSFLYCLKYEILPNRNIINYQYDSAHNLNQITTTNFNKTKTYSVLNIQRLNDKFILTSSDEKKLVYNFKKEKNYIFLISAQFPQKPDETYRYSPNEDFKPCILQRNKPQKRDFIIEYYATGKNIVNGKAIDIENPNDPRLMRVKSLKSRVGPNKELIETHKFIYNLGQDPKSGFTEIYEANNTKTIYRFSNLRLDAIEKYDEMNNLKNKEILTWGKGQNATKDVTFLLSKTFFDSKNNIIFHKEFIYDNKGNIIKENFYGNLSGKNDEIKLNSSISFENFINTAKSHLETFSIHKTYSQNEKNLLIAEENDDQVRTEYFYLADTDLIKSKIVKHKNKIKIRHFYEYDDDFVLTKEITDDGCNYDINNLSGITQRHIKIIHPKTDSPFLNMPQIIEEKYLDLNDRQEKLIKKSILTYSNQGKIVKEEIYNSKDKKEYTIEKFYNEKGNLIKEIDPQGHVTTYNKYDDNFNLLTKIDSNGKISNFEYDLANRLISKEEISTDNVRYLTSFSYDLKSNLIAITDYLKNTTSFKYDSFNNIIETQKPTCYGYAKTHNKYDDISRMIETKEAKGHITKTKYNTYNLPTKIIYADNSKEEFFYNLNGTLKKHIDQQNTITNYEYDFLQRDIKKTISSFDEKKSIFEEKNYNSFNLTSFKDFEGNTTFYEYDYAGRKISQRFLNENLNFLYDDLSRLTTTILADSNQPILNIQMQDYLNRIIEERKEDKNKNIFYKIQYEYDSQNNKTKIIRYIHNSPCIEKFKYDSFNRLTEHEDALGNKDYIVYSKQNNFLQIKHIDPVKLTTIQVYDSQNRLIKEEKYMGHNLLAKEEFLYDLADNLISQKSTIINQEDKSKKITEIRREFDEMNRMTTLIESPNSKHPKTTYFSYTKKGEIQQIIKPNQTVLTYEYNYLNQNTRFFSSNPSSVKPIDYLFKYNNLGYLIQAKDNISEATINRKLDHLGRLLSESFPNDFMLHNIYDNKGNRIKQILPDNSYIEYSYNPYYLKTITKKNSRHFSLYKHEMAEYDLDGNILKQNLINNTPILKQYNKLGKNTQIQNNFFYQEIDSFNPDGTIKQMVFSFSNQSDIANYEYDFLKQLTKETGIFTRNYSYDSHNNRLKKDENTYKINDLNQISNVSQEHFFYDKNGNLMQKAIRDLYIPDKFNINVIYKYDALDRLIYIEKPNNYKLEFEYDAFNRRLSQKHSKFVEGWISFDWQEISNLFYLYDNQNEIGCLDDQNNIQELRILSDTSNAEIGSSIAFEINNNIYLPIHDLQGNVACVVSDTNEAEFYRYTAFGEEKIYFNDQLLFESPINNKWRFSSKRKDESNLIYFGRRYYDTEHGRWLTPDPKGFNKDINLYAFVANDPLIKVDLYGLYANPYMFDFNKNYVSREKSQILPILGNPDSINKIFIINGQNNTKASALENAQYLYKNTKDITNNMGVVPIYTSTRGLLEDTIRALLQKGKAYVPKRINMVTKTLNDHANDLLDKKINTKSFIVSFSRGSMDLDTALQNLNKGQKDKFIIMNLGFSQAIAKENGFVVHNVRSSGDLISSITSPFSCHGIEKKKIP